MGHENLSKIGANAPKMARACGVELTTRVTREALGKRLRKPACTAWICSQSRSPLGSARPITLLRCNII
jgi:hypothetical protein